MYVQVQQQSYQRNTLPSPSFFSQPTSPVSYVQRPRVRSPRQPRNYNIPTSGYSLISQADAERLLQILKTQHVEFSQKREDYITRQLATVRGGKGDVVNEEECLEVSGEKISSFTKAVKTLGIFKDSDNCVVIYKKVPRTALQQKTEQPDNEEDLLSYLFSRWMRVDTDSIKLINKTGPDKELKMWRSLRTMNVHGTYVEMFVICSQFNRHLFHKEFLR